LSQGKILHICPLDKFIPPFIDFVKENFEFEQHTFLLMGDINKFPVQLGKNVIQLNRKSQIVMLLREMNEAEKVVLHSIFLSQIVWLLAFQPWLLKKCYWVIWGGDLYHYQFRDRDFRSSVYEKIRAFVIKRMGHLVTYFKGEYDLVKQWYDTSGAHHECFTYPSNIFQNFELKPQDHTSINIQIGNSATPTNQHFEVLEKLSVYKDQNIKIFVPLSYGDMVYAEKVIEFGKSKFGDKFVPMQEFITIDKYLDFLSSIDIAVFNHNRQQAIGNSIALLGLGKKVFMRTEVTSWVALQDLGLQIFDVVYLDVRPLEPDEADENKKKIAEHFSEVNLIAQLESVFYDI
jgi:dTDP-N-acetylfucosamine:lipid II N-acetylfucosaminyltransferase